MRQQGEGIRVSSAATPGGVITVNVGPNDDTVEVSVLGDSETKSFEVKADKDTDIPVPQVPPGTTLVVRVGKGNRKRRIYVEVVSLAP